MHEPLWCSLALLFQMLCMCNSCNRSRKRKWAKGSQDQTVLLIIPVVGMESKALSKPKLCVPFGLFFFPSATLLYPMDSPQDVPARSFVVSIFVSAPLQSAASLCAALLCYPSLTWPLSPGGIKALPCRLTSLWLCEETDQKRHGSFAAQNRGSGEVWVMLGT